MSLGQARGVPKVAKRLAEVSQRDEPFGEAASFAVQQLFARGEWPTLYLSWSLFLNGGH